MARTELLLGRDQMDVLRRSHVMLFGLGGVGSYVAEALGRMGIGKLTLVDGDHYEYSNLNRQLGAMVSVIGQNKAEVTKQRLMDINPDAQVDAVEAFYLPDSPVPIPGDVDIVADAVDTVSAKLHIVETCNAKHIPVISCMGMGNRLDPTRIKIGDLFETTHCALCRVMRKELRKRGIFALRCVYSTEDSIACDTGPPEVTWRRRVTGSVAYVPSVAGLLMAYDIVKTLQNRMGQEDRN